MIWLLALITAQASNPTTVNGQELGPAENFQTIGPARVCIENAAIDLSEGEVAQLQYAGIHTAVIRIDSPKGHLIVAHGDSWAKEPRRNFVYTNGPTTVYRAHRDGSVNYLFFAPSDYSRGKPELVLKLSGTLVNGGRKDHEALRRISIFSGVPPACVRRYAYGWDTIFGEEPLSKDRKEK